MRLSALRLTALLATLLAVSSLVCAAPATAQPVHAAPATPRVLPAWPAPKPNGRYTVAYARVDEISSSKVSFTVISGLSVAGIGSNISAKKASGRIDQGAVKAAASGVAVGQVVSLTGYVVDKSHTTSYMAYAGCTPTKYGCVANYIPAVRWDEEYELRISDLAPFAASRCATSQRVKVPVKWDMDPRIAVDVCVVLGEAWALVPSVDDPRYVVTGLSIEAPQSGPLRIPLLSGQWVRAAGTLPQGLSLSSAKVVLGFDVKDDGKPPYLVPLNLA